MAWSGAVKEMLVTTEDIREKFAVCGLEELPSHRALPITHVLSILDPGREEPECFADYGVHKRLTLRFHDEIEPWPGVILPEPAHVEELLRFGEEINLRPEKSDHLLVHCTMGVSRSTAAMATLLAQDLPELDEATIFARILRVRPQAWPNSRMIAFADELLGRNGRFVGALGQVYARQLSVRPRLADFMRQYRRQREVDMALA